MIVNQNQSVPSVDRKEQALLGTVKAFMERHSDEKVFMMTPGGYVFLLPEQICQLLSGQPVKANPATDRDCARINADELLSQSVENMNYADGVWYVITRYSQTSDKSQTAAAGNEEEVVWQG